MSSPTIVLLPNREITHCIICDDPIPILRKYLQPNTVTCCARHSDEHRLNLKAEASRRYRAKKRGECGVRDTTDN